MSWFAVDHPSAVFELVASAVVAALFLMAPTWVTIAVGARDRAVALTRRKTQLDQIRQSYPRLMGRVEKIDWIVSHLSPDAKELVCSSWQDVRAAVVAVLDGVKNNKTRSLSDDEVDVGWAALLRLPVIDWHVRHVQGIDDGSTDARMEALDRLREDMRTACYDVPDIEEELAVCQSKASWLAQDPHCPGFVAAYGRIVSAYGKIIAPYLGAEQSAIKAADTSTGGVARLWNRLMSPRTAAYVTSTTIASRAWFPGVGLGGVRPWIASGGGGLAAVEQVKKFRITITMAALLWGVLMVVLQIAAAIYFPQWGWIGAIAFLVTTVLVIAFTAVEAHRRGCLEEHPHTHKPGPVTQELNGRVRDVALAEITRIAMILNDIDLLARSLTGGSTEDPLFVEWKKIRAAYDRDTMGFVEAVDSGQAWQSRTWPAYQAASDMGNAETNIHELFHLVHADSAVRMRHIRQLRRELEAAKKLDADFVAQVAAQTSFEQAADPLAEHPRGAYELVDFNSLDAAIDSLAARPDSHDFLERYTAIAQTLHALQPVDDTQPAPQPANLSITSSMWRPLDILGQRSAES